MAHLQSQPSLVSTLPKNLPAAYIKEITNDFSAEQELGRSVFGTVYKGVLPSGGMIAVKRFAENAPVPAGKTFETEITNLMALKHQNIVELVGFCHESQRKVVQHNGRDVIVENVECCLCYRYLPMGSLDKYLYGDTTSMNWDTQFKIIKGICQGVHFIHKELVVGPLIHMNLVPNSVWLDDNFVPKIDDIGLSRLFGIEQTRMYSVNVEGHNRYIAPEYLYRGEISTMSDIYSLGMIILEITTRERNYPASEDRSARQFVDNVHQNWKTDEQIIYKYPSLDPNGLEQVKACIQIGLKCVEADRQRRPSIVDIVNRLNERRVPIFDQPLLNHMAVRIEDDETTEAKRKEKRKQQRKWYMIWRVCLSLIGHGILFGVSFITGFGGEETNGHHEEETSKMWLKWALMELIVPSVLLIVMFIIQIFFIDLDLEEEDTSQQTPEDKKRVERKIKIVNVAVLAGSKLVYVAIKGAPGPKDTLRIIAHVVAFVIDMGGAIYLWWKHSGLDQELPESSWKED